MPVFVLLRKSTLCIPTLMAPTACIMALFTAVSLMVIILCMSVCKFPITVPVYNWPRCVGCDPSSLDFGLGKCSLRLRRRPLPCRSRGCHPHGFRYGPRPRRGSRDVPCWDCPEPARCVPPRAVPRPGAIRWIRTRLWPEFACMLGLWYIARWC